MAFPTKKQIQQLSELEIYELVCAAYPEKFGDAESKPDGAWDEVMEFAEELFEESDKAWDFIARLVYLTPPSGSGLSGKAFHSFGEVTGTPAGGFMVMSVVKREVIE